MTDPHKPPPWFPYTQGDPVPMGEVRIKTPSGYETETYYTAWDWSDVTHYQRHPDHQLIADMRDDLCFWLEFVRYSDATRALILRAEAVVGRAPGLPQWLKEYLDVQSI